MYYHTEGLRVKAGVSAESPSSESSRGGSALLFPPCRGCWGPLALRGLWEHVFNLCLHLQPHGRLFSESGPSSNKDRSHWIRSTLMQLGGYPGGGVCVCVCVAELCPTLCDPMDCSQQAPLPLGFFWQEYWTGKSREQSRLVGYSPWNHKVRHNWATEHTHTHTHGSHFN